jgi:hypothetical protein
MQKENGSYVNQLIRGIYFIPNARNGLPKLCKRAQLPVEHPRLTHALPSRLAAKKMRTCCLRFLLGLNRKQIVCIITREKGYNSG